MAEVTISLDEPRLTALARTHGEGLCDACLGRLAARVEPGLRNLERGRRLRSLTGLPEPSVCGLCEGLAARIPRWAELCLKAAEGYEYESFLVGCVHYGAIRRREQELYARLWAADGTLFPPTTPAKAHAPVWPAGEWLKNEINREVGLLLAPATGKRVDFERPDLTFRIDTRLDHVELQVASVHVKGRYRKHVRDLPQTRWPCRSCGGIGCRRCGGSGKTYATSVEELVAAPFLEAAQAEEEAFHGMGREDIDARTLGPGRPFILELKRPRRRRLAWHALARRVNETNPGRVELLDVGPAGPDDAARYKAADPVKVYRARCRSHDYFDAGKLLKAALLLAGVTLQQRTPQRVAHRRADLVRERRVLDIKVLDVAETRFELEIRADSGTYIKEFVSGDEGRTTPSIADHLGVACRVEELDVVDVEWKE